MTRDLCLGCGQPHNVYPTAKINIVKYPICLRVLNAGHVAVGSDQIGLVAADNRTTANHRFKFRAIGASSSGLRSSFALLQPEQLVIGTSSLLLLLSISLRIFSKKFNAAE